MQFPKSATTYAEAVRLAMKTSDNATGAPLSVREVSSQTGFSYEHTRKVIKGEPVVSEDFNERLCLLLGLPESVMWKLAIDEKLKRRYAGIPVNIQPPPGDFFADIWEDLTSADIETLVKVARALAADNRRQSAALTRSVAAERKSA